MLQDTIETDECLEIFRLACLSVLQSCLPFPSSRRILLLLTRVLLWFVSIADQRFKEASIRWESVVASILCSFDGQCNTGSKCWKRSESTWQWVWWSGLKPQVWLQTEFTYREVFRRCGKLLVVVVFRVVSCAFRNRLPKSETNKLSSRVHFRSWATKPHVGSETRFGGFVFLAEESVTIPMK